MSDIAPVLESSAKDLAESGEQAGKAVEKHLGEGIGDGLDDASKGYQNVDDLHGRKFDDLNPNKAAGSAPKPPAEGGGNDPFKAGGGVDGAGGENLGGADDDGSLAPSSEDGVTTDAHEDGSGGQSDDPIDLVTGEMFLPQQDLLLPGILPLVLERRHGSGYRRGRCFGTTWSSTLDQRIQVDQDGIHYAAPDGRVLHYPVPTQHGQKVLPAVGPRWPLSWNRREDRITIEQTDLGRTLEFPPGPTPGLCRPLAAMADRSGNRVMFAYDGEGVPTDIHHGGGYHVVIGAVTTRGGTRISTLKLADPCGGPHLPIIEFRYDRAGRLTETINASGRPMIFEYDEADRITRWIDRNGHDYRYHYGQDGRVTHTEGSGGYLACRLEYDLESRTTTITDALGQPTVYHWNERLQTVKVVDPLGNTTLTEQDKHGNILSRTDPLDRTTRIDRDENSDPIRITRPDQSTIAVTYNSHRQPERVAGPDGGTWVYEYDDRGNMTAATDPEGATTRYDHDERGRLASVTDPTGAVSTVTCDKAGLPNAVTDPLGNTSRITRDKFGHIASTTDPLGATTSSTWTVDGKPLTRTLPDGTGETWTYDAEGNLLIHVDPTGAATRFEYGPFDTPIARTDPTGARYLFGYDLQLHLTSVTNPQGAAWQYTYDPAGNLIAEKDFNGRALTYEYDAAGQLGRRTNGAGQVMTYLRDPLGNLTERHDGDAVTSFQHDALGRLSRVQNAGGVLEYVRDALGRVIAETLDGRTLTNDYDAAGRRLRRTTPAGLTSQWSYDEAGQPSSLATSDGGWLTIQRDQAGREVQRALGPGAVLTSGYDTAGRLASQQVWAFDRPGAGQDRPSPAPHRLVQERTYSFRADGFPLQITDLLRGTRAYTLDPVGRVTTVTAATWQETYAYDSLGNLTAADRPGDPDTNGPQEHTGTLTRRAGRTTYEHDAQGRVVRTIRRTLSGQTRESNYTWDAEDRLVQATTADGQTWAYSYDPLGRRSAKRRVGHDGAVLEEVWYTWDGPLLAEQVATGTDARATAVTWDYDPETFRPAAQTRRTWAAHAPQPDIDTEFYAIVTDLVGAPQELVTPDGRIAWRQTTSLWGATIDAPDATTDCPLRCPGQYRDDETGLHYNFFRYYDPATAAYVSADPLGLVPAPNQHSYVGNPLDSSDPLGLAPCAKQAWSDKSDFTNPKTLSKKYDAHAGDFGISGNRNTANLKSYVAAMKTHMVDPDTKIFRFNYRSQGAAVGFINPGSGLMVMLHADGTFWSGWSLADPQFTDIVDNGHLW